MSIILEQLLNGLTIGSFYALIALGYSMVYGVMKLINFAHGDLFALGSYLGYTLLVWSAGAVSQRFGLWGGMAAALLFAFFAVGCAGVLMERVAYRPVQKSGRLPLVVSALGVSIFLENLIMAVWGPRYQAYPASVVPTYTISLGWFHITSMQLFILILSFVLMLILYYVVQKQPLVPPLGLQLWTRRWQPCWALMWGRSLYLYSFWALPWWHGRSDERHVLSPDLFRHGVELRS